ncbi:MAG: protein phosphatase 2C domain-containing protein, partial [Telluria sp.]
GATDIGTVRSSNEDNFLIDAALGLAMVADGMGGHAAGEVASAAVLTALRDYLAAHGSLDSGGDMETADPDATWSDPAMRGVSLLHDAIEFANRSLYQRNMDNDCEDGGGMGTTLTGIWRAPGKAPLILFHVGDSRLYRQRAGQLEQLTRDHTMYQQALDAGMLDNLPSRNMLLQAMGPSPSVAPEVRSQVVQPGDLLMLCSDGLHGSVPHGEIETAMSGATPDTLAAVCAGLIARAKECGGRDNITILIILCQDTPA